MDIAFKDHLEKLLLKDARLVADQGELKGNVVKKFANELDETLIGCLIEDERTRDHFFLKVKDVYVFKANDFIFFLEQNKLDNSFTKYANRIGLTLNGKFLKDNTDIVLDFPYKDCILEGGQSTEEGLDSYYEFDTELSAADKKKGHKTNQYNEKQAKRKEIFFNNIIAKDEQDRLLEPKAFTNIVEYSKDGTKKLSKFNRNKEGVITNNLIFKGNNLLALHSLKNEFKGKVKLIYIDPPYNTGNDSFAYNDNFNHSSWLTFVYNRIIIAKELLSDKGTMAISIDHNEVSQVIILMDEVFGRANKKNIVTIKRSSVSGAKVINPGVVNVSEFLLIYSIGSNWSPNKVFKEKERDNRYNTFITNFEDDSEKWKYCSVLEAFAAFKNIPKNKLKKELGTEYDILLENFYYDNKEKIIRFAGLDDNSISSGVKEVKYISKSDTSKTYLFERDGFKDYYLYQGNAILFFKDRLIKVEDKWRFGEMISDIWNDVLPNDIHNEGGVTLRKGKKPEKMLERLMELSTSEGDIVLDYHLGSGTTAAVAHKLKRQYIGIEQLDYQENDSVVRLQNVINGDSTGVSKSSNWQGGGGFIYLELAKNNEKAKELIQSCKTFDELVKLFDTLYSKYFLHYNIRIKDFKESIIKEDQFKALSLNKQKEMFCRMLDNNQLYVNRDEMEDKQFGIAKEDIALTKYFYQIK